MPNQSQNSSDSERFSRTSVRQIPQNNRGNKHMKTIMNIIQTAFTGFALACVAALTDAQAVVPPPDGGYPNFNTAEGQNALLSLTTGAANTAVGWYSLFSDTEGGFNTATGAGALLFNTTANANTAFGTAALLFNTTGFNNTAVGAAALLNNTEGSGNTANGQGALVSNTIGNHNVADGLSALNSNTEGNQNTAIGDSALFSNTTGFNNTATGSGALFNNTIGNFNTANGNGALGSNTQGTNNTAIGQGALLANTDGGFNAAFGSEALNNLASGSGNVGIGPGAGSTLTSGDGNIYVGNPGVTTETATIRIGTPDHGAAFIGGISGTAVVGDTVVVDANGQLGTLTSSARFKTEIKPMDKTSEAILALKPVSFQYKSDSKGTPQFGLIAEEVAKVNPNLVVRDRKGEIYTVRYEAVNAMLLNEFLKEHRKVEKQQATMGELKSTLAQQRKDFEVTATQQQKAIQALTASFKEQASQIQKVSAQLEVSKLTPQVVVSE